MPISDRTSLIGRIQLDRADRLQRMPVRLDADLDRIAERLRQRGVEVFDLSFRSAPLDTQQVSLSPAQGETLGPATPGATASLRESVAQWYQQRFGVHLNPATEIDFTPNANLAAALIALSFIDAGDMALLPDPGPQMYRTAVILAGGGVIPYPLLERNDYLPNLSAMENGLAGRLRLMVVGYPNDPTTAMSDLGAFAEIVAFGRKNNIIVLSEGGFAQAAADAIRPHSILEVRGARGTVVELLPFNDAFGIPNLPLTAVSGNRDVIAALRFMTELAGLAPVAPQVALAHSLLDQANDLIKARMERLQRSRKIITEALAKLSWRVRSSATTPFVWAAVPTAMDTGALCRRLLRRTGIRIKPGTAFGERGEGFVRIALPENLQTAQTIAERLDSHARLYQRRIPRGRRARRGHASDE
ncbi:MAG: aminotransferase class I/II-fold pyridoxal phosphate-dependent enzyme [Candidatus Zixiibacteriota bacterium]